LATCGTRPAAARSGGVVCRKLKLKNFYQTKIAGGCGVAPILSAKHLLCRGCGAASATLCLRSICGMAVQWLRLNVALRAFCAVW